LSNANRPFRLGLGNIQAIVDYFGVADDLPSDQPILGL